MNKKRSRWLDILAIAAAAIVAYFVNVAIQTRLGEKAFQATGLPRHSLEQALEAARAENKLVLADLSAIWCPSCRALDRDVLSDPAVQSAIAAKYVFARVEYDSPEGKAFAERYGVSGFPVLLALAPDGEMVRRLPFAREPAAFIEGL